jgi:hypothetical protein
MNYFCIVQPRPRYLWGWTAPTSHDTATDVKIIRARLNLGKKSLKPVFNCGGKVAA